MAEKKGGDLKAFYMVLGAAAVVAAGALGWSAFGGGLSSAAMEPTSSIVLGEIEDVEALVEMATGVERGDPNAPITILEFGDFQCPSCRQFFSFVKPQLDLAYVDEGVARFVFHDFPVVSAHRYAFFAARGARCALDQGEQYFWPFHDQLFSQQPTWGAVPPNELSATAVGNTFEGYAGTLGLDVEEFAACLDSDRHADVVSANMRLGIELGVDRTPTVFVSKGGRSVRVTRWNEFEAYQSVIDRMIEEDAGDGI